MATKDERAVLREMLGSLPLSTAGRKILQARDCSDQKTIRKIEGSDRPQTGNSSESAEAARLRSQTESRSQNRLYNGGSYNEAPNEASASCGGESVFRTESRVSKRVLRRDRVHQERIHTENFPDSSRKKHVRNGTIR